jgi:hypothetical protein
LRVPEKKHKARLWRVLSRGDAGGGRGDKRRSKHMSGKTAK